MRTSRLSVCVLSALIILPLLAAADDTRGRLPDGRAFRTDAQGLQLIDYTAELEVNIETLNRRIQSLEQQLAERDQRLARSGGAPVGELQERTIGSSAPVTVAASSHSCPPAPQLTCPAADCSSEVAAVRAELTAKASSRDETIAAYQQAIDRQGVRTKALNERIALQANELAQNALALEGTQKQLANLQRVNADLVSKLDRADADRAILARAAPAPRTEEVVPVRAIAEPPSEPRAALSVARLQALDSVRGTVTRELNELNALLTTRSSVYNNRKNRSGPVTFTLQPPRSRDGKTLAIIRQQIREADQMRELAALRADIQQIQNLVQEDIALIQRMDRSAQGR